MPTTRHNSGLTLVEILVVLSIVVTLTLLSWRGFSALEEQSEERRQRQSFDLIEEALEAYTLAQNAFPPQVELLGDALLKGTLALASEALYTSLSWEPASQGRLARISRNMVVAGPRIDPDGNPLQQIRDAWGTLVFYYWDPDAAHSFPLLHSAGPDKVFQTMDDINNK